MWRNTMPICDVSGITVPRRAGVLPISYCERNSLAWTVHRLSARLNGVTLPPFLDILYVQTFGHCSPRDQRQRPDEGRQGSLGDVNGRHLAGGDERRR